MPQGCTASTIVFDLCFQVVLDTWKWVSQDVNPHYSIGDDHSISFSCPIYADDIKLIASNPPDCQKSIDAFQSSLEWTQTLKAKPAKCRALAFRDYFAKKKGLSSRKCYLQTTPPMIHF